MTRRRRAARRFFVSSSFACACCDRPASGGGRGHTSGSTCRGGSEQEAAAPPRHTLAGATTPTTMSPRGRPAKNGTRRLAPPQYTSGYFFGIDGYADTCTWSPSDSCTGFACGAANVCGAGNCGACGDESACDAAGCGVRRRPTAVLLPLPDRVPRTCPRPPSSSRRFVPPPLPAVRVHKPPPPPARRRVPSPRLSRSTRVFRFSLSPPRSPLALALRASCSFERRGARARAPAPPTTPSQSPPTSPSLAEHCWAEALVTTSHRRISRLR